MKTNKSLFREVLAYLAHPFIPLSKKNKRDIIDKYNAAIDTYLPLIEERTGIDMGSVQANDLKSQVREICANIIREMEKNTNPRFKGIMTALAKGVIYPTTELLRIYLEDSIVSSYDPKSQRIIVPFGLDTKKLIYYESLFGNTQQLDEIVLHELTHHLWHRIAKGFPLHKDFRLLNEGFATYGAYRWFADFLPAGRNLEDLKNFPKIYHEGLKTIEGLVETHGSGVLFEIPRNYRSFKAELEAAA